MRILHSSCFMNLLFSISFSIMSSSTISRLENLISQLYDFVLEYNTLITNEELTDEEKEKWQTQLITNTNMFEMNFRQIVHNPGAIAQIEQFTGVVQRGEQLLDMIYNLLDIEDEELEEIEL